MREKSAAQQVKLYEQPGEFTFTDGKAVGQVTGLSVFDVGTFSFGFPLRITATTRLGEGEVVDIEREVDMGGPIHSKGVFILPVS